jgi:hypothetical protein
MRYGSLFMLILPGAVLVLGSLLYLLAVKSGRSLLASGWRSLVTGMFLSGGLLLLVYYSLVLHVYLSCDGWPSIVEGVSSGMLDLHSRFMFWLLVHYLLFNIIACPVFVVVFAVAKPLRCYLPLLLGIYLSFWLALPLMIYLAPVGFVDWWFD